jgi:hypothetical protein
MKNAIIFCFIIFLITCSKEKKEPDIKEIYPEQINTVSIDDIEVERSEEIFYALESKIYDSYNDYVTKQSSYPIIEDELKYYSENYVKDIFVQDFFSSFTLIANKLFLTQLIPEHGDIPEHTAIETYDINWEETGKFAYILFNYNGKLLGRDIQHGYKRYLVIYSNNNRVSLYDQNNKMVYLASSLRYILSSDFDVQASSELQENNIKYSVENCLNENELIPWAEGSSENGIGEYITFIPQHEIIFSNIPIVISNGFIDYNRNYLYEYNNRIKKIRIYNVDQNEYLDFNIEDTPNYQEIWVSFNNKISKIKVEILEVYQSERYNDLCINLFKPYSF